MKKALLIKDKAQLLKARLYYATLLHGIGIAELSKELGIPRTTISNWTRGICKAPVHHQQRIADFLGVNRLWLF